MLERVLKFSLEHRYLVVLITLFAAAAGTYSFTQLKIDAVPDITNNQVAINTSIPSLSSEEVERQVAYIIETSLAGIPGLQETRSISRNGFCQIIAIFDDAIDPYFARQQITERISEMRGLLPSGAEPSLGPMATGLGEVYMYALAFEHEDGQGAEVKSGEPGWQSDGTYLTQEGETLRTEAERLAYLRTLQDWVIKPQLRGIPGLADVETLGGYQKQYQIRPNPRRLASFGLTFDDLAAAVQRNNSSIGGGYVERNGEGFAIRADGRVRSLDELSNLVIEVRNNAPIYIRDVAELGIGGELRAGTATMNGREVVGGTALMLVGANSRIVAKLVGDRITEVRRTLPPDIALTTVIDRTRLVDATIRTVAKNLIEGAVLVVIVLFLLLGNARAAFIATLAIPLSMLIAAFGMVQFNVSGNLMSLGAIDFGLIVDGAVIIIENCLRELNETSQRLNRRLTMEERVHTILHAATQVRSATAFGEAIIITVYIPILLLTGTEGKMFQPMAATVIFALAGAFVLSLTFIPALAGIVLRGAHSDRQTFFMRMAHAAYAPLLHFALRARYAVIAGAIAILAGTVFMMMQLGQEFIPQLDEGDFDILTARIPSMGLTESTRLQMEVEKELMKFPEVKLAYSKTGTADMASDPLAPCNSDTFVVLKAKSEWPNPNDSKEALRERIESALEEIPGIEYEYSQPIEDRFNEMIEGVRQDVAIKVYGDTYENILPVAKAITAVVQKVPGAADVQMQQVEGLPMIDIEYDRAALTRYGISVADVESIIATAGVGREAGTVFEGDRRFPIVVRLADNVREDLRAIEELPVPLPKAKTPVKQEEGETAPSSVSGGVGYVPLKEVAHLRVTEGLNEIGRDNAKRRIYVKANVRGRDIASFVEDAKKQIADGVNIPAGIWLEWGGQFETLVAARERLAIVVPFCLLLIMLLLFTSFGSMRLALLVFSGVPFALTGGVLSLWLRGYPFSITAAVGLIALSGVAVLNGLVMVTVIHQLLNEGHALQDAIRKGSLMRLRPVLTTALVASLGFIPMALATGTGAEVQKPLATVVIGGLISSTILTLLVLPALYRVFGNSKADGPKLRV
ncbi:MAG: CusA/CzcA family heavy metal efflux RND transporter [Candidatus Hydrogenedentes bacterium]|nr:CusA/CzcA family heavy metal efflux RND transporter [Candidatus Hydrogenedentota bacterium]